MIWIEAFFGALLALAGAAYFARASPRGERRAYAQGLAIAALIYVAFALIGGATIREIGLEIGGVAFYGALAAVGLRFPLALVIGWAAHVGWDLLLHHPAQSWVPSWYPGACLGFDLVFAVVIAWRFRVFASDTLL